jgi:hypothetical protein
VTRLPARAAVALSVLLVALLLGAASASADPSLVLSRSEAGAGEVVQFSIAGTKDEVTYAVEVAEHEVAAGAGASGAFTMPDLGATARTVTVRVEVAGSDETTTLSRKLGYVPAAPAPVAPAAGTPAPAVAPAPAAQRAISPRPASGHSKTKRRHPRRPARKRRAGTAPLAAPDTLGPASPENPPRRSQATNPTTSSTATSPASVPARHRSPAKGKPSNEGTRPTPAKPGGIFGRDLMPSLTTSLATLSPAAAAADESGPASLTAVIVFTMLALTALAVARGPRRRIAAGASRQAGDDDEILQGVVHVPASREPPASL